MLKTAFYNWHSRSDKLENIIIYVAFTMDIKRIMKNGNWVLSGFW